ncbi:MAG: manganese efflux pump [Chloroflexi bacterium]|nr:manganese efflux pump [Chloroflexota bacterium]
MLNGSSFIPIFFIAIGLSADCFAVALSGGISNRNYTARQVLRVSTSFGLFQATMPVLGWLAGETIVDYIARYDHWVAFGLLVLVSGRMLWESFRSQHTPEKEINITRITSLLVLSVATSIDALAVGLSLAFLRVNIAIASLTIGAVAFVVTALGFVAGRNVGKFVGRWAEIVGAVLLLAIAFRILSSHIL